MKPVLSQSTCLLLASSSFTIAMVRLVQWRARKRAKIAADRVQGMVKPGPLIDAGDKAVCEHVVNSAIRRASKWISFQLSAKDGSVMIGQVGGVSVHKRPLLTLEPDYVMKPVHTDHRGMREIFLYEAVKVLSKSRNSQQYAALLTGGGNKKQLSQSQPQQQNNQLSASQHQQNSNNSPQTLIDIFDLWDTIAMWLAMKMNDPLVAENEKTMNKSWKTLKKEVDTLRKLASFIPAYYGVVGQRSPLSMPHGEEQAHNAVHGEMLKQTKMKNATMDNGDAKTTGTTTTTTTSNVPSASHFGISLEAHLLLTDVTAKFYKPCVVDIKMGTRTYEPGAPEDKKLREIAKYPLQEKFGFRIVGMRFYDPTHPEADGNGFRFFSKEYGRSLATIEDLLAALRLFMSAGCVKSTVTENNGSRTTEEEQEAARDKAGGDGEGDNINGNASSATTTDQNEMSGSSSSATDNNKTGIEDGVQTAEGNERVRIRALSSLRAQLRPIMGFFEENNALCFYSSSLLMVYEGDREAPNPDVTCVKMIDFGRVRRQSGGDQGYRLGLKTLKSVLDRITKEEKAAASQTATSSSG